MSLQGEGYPSVEANPPSPEFWDDKSHVLFCMDGELRPVIDDFNRANRSEIMSAVGLVDPAHIDEYSPELWAVPPEQFWSRLLSEYADGGFDIDELVELEDSARWSFKEHRPESLLSAYFPLLRTLYDEDISTQLIGDLDSGITDIVMRALEGNYDDEDYISTFILPDSSLPDVPGGYTYSGVTTGLSLEKTETYKQLVPSRTVVITDSPKVVEPARQRGYTVIGMGEQFQPSEEQVQPHYTVQHPDQITVNRLPDPYEGYEKPASVQLLDADGTVEFWVSAFWNQVAHEPKVHRGWDDSMLRRLGFEGTVVRKTTMSAVRTKHISGPHTDKLSPLALTLLAYDGTPYRGNEGFFEHETLIDRFQKLFESQDLGDSKTRTLGTHLFEDSAGNTILYTGTENTLQFLVQYGQNDLTGAHSQVDPRIIAVMNAYGIDYLVSSEDSGKGTLIDKNGTYREVQTLTDEELQKQAIDRMVKKAARDNGFTKYKDPELWRMYEAEVWEHWDADLPINVFELAASLGSLAAQDD